jgi:hypothetical protein
MDINDGHVDTGNKQKKTKSGEHHGGTTRAVAAVDRYCVIEINNERRIARHFVPSGVLDEQMSSSYLRHDRVAS